MPWSYPDNVPSCAKNWSAEEQEKCTKAANAVLRDGGTEEKAIFACIHAAGRTKHPGGKEMAETTEVVESTEAKGGEQEATPQVQQEPTAEARPTDLRSLLMLDTAQGVPSALPIHIIGQWDHPSYGKFEFTKAMGDQAIANFQGRVYRPNAPVTAQVVVDEQHAGGEANGWLENMFWSGQLLMGGVSWTERGRKLIADRRYRYISPAYSEDYEGKGVTFKEVTLTNRNFLKELPAIDQPVLLSEDVARGAFLTPVSLSLREGGKGMDEKTEKKAPVEEQKKEAAGTIQATPGQVQLSEDQLKSLQEQAGRAKELEKRLAVLEREAKGREIEAAVQAAGARGVDAFTLNFCKGLLMQLPRDGNQDMELEVKDAAPQSGTMAPQKANGYQAWMYFLQHVPGVVPTGEKTKALDKPPAGEETIDKGKAKALAEAVSDSLPEDKEE